MGDEAQERVPESELTTGSNLPARVRSAFLTRGRSRAPEPRVRFGWSLLPGLGCLGSAQRSAAGPVILPMAICPLENGHALICVLLGMVA